MHHQRARQASSHKEGAVCSEALKWFSNKHRLETTGLTQTTLTDWLFPVVPPHISPPFSPFFPSLLNYTPGASHEPVGIRNAASKDLTSSSEEHSGKDKCRHTIFFLWSLTVYARALKIIHNHPFIILNSHGMTALHMDYHLSLHRGLHINNR